MTETLQAPYVVDKAEDLNKLPVDSVVLIKESEFGAHVSWQLTADIIDRKDKPEKAWASIFYKSEHDSIDLLNMSYDKKVLVLYIHPAK